MSGLRVAVIGAGIAGLTLAAWLRRTGITCEVYEQAEQPREVGAGIQLAPNGARLLHRLGLGPDLERLAVRPSAMEIRRWRDGRVVGWTTLGDECEARYGGAYYTMSRPDLHRSLLAAATRSPVGQPVRYGRRLVGLRETPTGVELSFMDGSATTADLVVGADGLRSVVRGALDPDEPHDTGQVAHRALVPADRLHRLDPNQRVTVFAGPRQHCVWYPVSPDWYSVAAVTSEPAGATASGGAERDTVLARFAGWHDDVSAVLTAAEDLRRWPLYQRAALSRWHSGRVTVIGDAAHPLLPFGAQGANQAIESAVTLATCLSRTPDITDAVRRYARIRAPRLSQVAARVDHNADKLHLSDGAAQWARDQDLRRSGPDDLVWLFGYDAEAASGDRFDVGPARTVDDSSVSAGRRVAYEPGSVLMGAAAGPVGRAT